MEPEDEAEDSEEAPSIVESVEEEPVGKKAIAATAARVTMQAGQNLLMSRFFPKLVEALPVFIHQRLNTHLLRRSPYCPPFMPIQKSPHIMQKA